MKKTIILAVLALTVGCSDDDNTPPTTDVKPYVFDKSVIKHPAMTIGCAVLNGRDYDIHFTKKIGDGCPDTGDITFLDAATGSILTHYKGGLRINLELEITTPGDAELKNPRLQLSGSSDIGIRRYPLKPKAGSYNPPNPIDLQVTERSQITFNINYDNDFEPVIIKGYASFEKK